MTVRPRYTLTAKARDLRALPRDAAPYAHVLISYVAPHARLLAVALANGAIQIITSRYTDPKEPR